MGHEKKKEIINEEKSKQISPRRRSSDRDSRDSRKKRKRRKESKRSKKKKEKKRRRYSDYSDSEDGSSSKADASWEKGTSSKNHEKIKNKDLEKTSSKNGDDSQVNND